MPQCIVKNCKNRTRSRPVLGQIKEKNINNVSYHRFPKNEKAKLLWLDILELNAELVPIGARICSAHFAEDAFNFLYGTKRLRPNALPYIERVIENVPNDGIIASSSICNTLKIDRATSPIPGCSHFADQSTNTSPKRDHNALEKEYLHKKLQDTKTSFSKKFKLLQQKVRRKESRIITLEAILNSLKKNNMLGTEELQILQDIDDISTPSY
ncbi:THAP-type domain-containing protein [Camponotus japonicus]